MIIFCPVCSNLLTITRNADPEDPNNRFECRTCPYQYTIVRPVRDVVRFPRKKAEDVIGGADSWENVDWTEHVCEGEECEATEAYFYQVQIRSADEPMTTFLKCVGCGRQSREG